MEIILAVLTVKLTQVFIALLNPMDLLSVLFLSVATEFANLFKDVIMGINKAVSVVKLLMVINVLKIHKMLQSVF